MKKPIIVKIGSQLVLSCQVNRKHSTACHVLQQLLRASYKIQCSGQPIVLVVSGAVGTGKQEGLLHSLQAQAARGQYLLSVNLASLAPHEMRLALLLLSREDIVNRERYLSLQKTFEELLEYGIVPMVNENDATTTKGKNDFPDNDYLAAILSITLDAAHLFLLTDVKGVYSSHPDDAGAQLYAEITNVNLELIKTISGKRSALGRGGMRGKLQAARIATAAGIPVHIIDGRFPDRIVKILSGEQHGTFCRPRMHKGFELRKRDRWLMSAKGSTGTIQLDEGAAQAVQQRKSLLAVGIRSIHGDFEEGDSVEMTNSQKETIAIGLVNQSSRTLRGFLSTKKRPYNVEVVHADNLILI